MTWEWHTKGRGRSSMMQILKLAPISLLGCRTPKYCQGGAHNYQNALSLVVHSVRRL